MQVYDQPTLIENELELKQLPHTSFCKDAFSLPLHSSLPPSNVLSHHDHTTVPISYEPCCFSPSNQQDKFGILDPVCTLLLQRFHRRSCDLHHWCWYWTWHHLPSHHSLFFLWPSCYAGELLPTPQMSMMESNCVSQLQKLYLQYSITMVYILPTGFLLNLETTTYFLSSSVSVPLVRTDISHQQDKIILKIFHRQVKNCGLSCHGSH